MSRQAIDGMSRELALRLLLGSGSELVNARKELRALLDAPVFEPLEIGYFEHQQSVNFEFCPVDTRLIWTLPSDQRHIIPQHFKVFIHAEQQWHGKPAAQPHGEPEPDQCPACEGTGHAHINGMPVPGTCDHCKGTGRDG
ncbi:hypothetical protein SKUL_69 [Pseudomonas phage Skulduggery]|uniref:Uncharacterized protein n=1 Tax=Pseudomonas phage Skulduggery TaxID=2006671 RepID=A0A1Y0T0X8_9CAUD|nr:hypothetical protein PP627_gp69 [Pseudomonas phage Skulduggery]ARV77168.1 hypothetical protein SKUL_69 [Pseudomonas phage Skulduggery]